MTQPHLVYLSGRLKKKFGGPFVFHIHSAAEAIRALCANFPAFRAEFSKGHYRLIAGPRKTGEDINLDLLEFGLPTGKALHIVPVVAGRGSGGGNGTGKALIGAAVLGVALIASGGMAAGLATPIFGGVTWGTVATFGAALTLAGVSQMLTPTPKTPDIAKFEAQPDLQSFLLGGQTNSIEQGHAIPIILGKIRVGGLIISGGIAVEEIV